MGLGIDMGEGAGQQPIAGHGVENSSLAIEGGERGGGEPDQRAELHDEGEAREADHVDRLRDRIRHVQIAIGHEAGEHGGNRDVEDRADEQRADQSLGCIGLRVATLAHRRRDGLEPDEGEEHHGRAPEDPAHTEMAELADVCRYERVPQLRLHRRSAEADEGDDDRDLQGYQRCVNAGGLADGARQQAVSASTTITAGRSTYPPAPGAAETDAGRRQPKSAISDCA